MKKVFIMYAQSGYTAYLRAYNRKEALNYAKRHCKDVKEKFERMILVHKDEIERLNKNAIK